VNFVPSGDQRGCEFSLPSTPRQTSDAAAGGGPLPWNSSISPRLSVPLPVGVEMISVRFPVRDTSKPANDEPFVDPQATGCAAPACCTAITLRAVLIIPA
jgi:hypothetical protein